MSTSKKKPSSTHIAAGKTPSASKGKKVVQPSASFSSDPLDDSITDIDVSSELSASFLEYAMSVIVARALPDVRDGLKPVHRRILYSLYSQGIKPNSPYKKCARVVGDTMGKYHPHGDSAIYEALVRLAQSWSMRLPLVDGHGNFGSLDDGPAASRYTECRMSYPAMSLVDEIYEDTVAMRPNYDGNEMEPEVLPAAFPNLLVNGSTGIAVGMATNMPPHNIGEVVEGLVALLDNRKLSLHELMEYIPGPDLPSGGTIMGVDGVTAAYATGRGSFTMRAVVDIEDLSSKKKALIVRELPYNVGPEKVVARIKELVSAKKLQGISDIKDYSDRKSGLRLVIECKNGFDPQAILEELYRLTPLQEAFPVNNVALVNGAPETLGLVALCNHYLSHRIDVVRKRSQYRLSKCQAREHILKGLLIALENIDAVVKTIRSSENSAAAKLSLAKKYKLSEVQAEAILEMALRRLTSLEVSKIKEELQDLSDAIEGLLEILGSDKVLRKLVATELKALAKTYGTPRRSVLVSGSLPVASGSVSVKLDDSPCTVLLSSTSLISIGDGSVPSTKVSKNDLYLASVPTTTGSSIGVVTTRGLLYRVPVSSLPVFSPSSKGIKASSLFELSSGEQVQSLVDTRPGRFIVLGTSLGNVKKLSTDELPVRLDARTITGLTSGETVVSAYSIDVSDDSRYDTVFVSSDAQLIRFATEGVSSKGIAAGTVRGMSLGGDATVVHFGLFDHREPAFVVTVSDGGSVKVSDVHTYPVVNRGGKGVRGMNLRKNESGVTAACVSKVLPIGVSHGGSIVRYPVEVVKRDASGSPTETVIERFLHVR